MGNILTVNALAGHFNTTMIFIQSYYSCFILHIETLI